MIAKFIIYIAAACFISVLSSFGLKQIFPVDVAAMLSFFVGIICGAITVSAAFAWDARSTKW